MVENPCPAFEAEAGEREERTGVRPWIRQVGEGIRARYRRLFPERQIFLRASGRVRFVRLSPHLQAVAALGAAALVGWLVYASAVAIIGNPQQVLEARKARYLARELDLLSAELARLQEQGLKRIERLEASQRVLEAAVGVDADPAPPSAAQTTPARQGGGEAGADSSSAEGPDRISLLARRTDELLARLSGLEPRAARLAAVMERREEERLSRARTLFAALELAQPLAAVEDEPRDARAVGGPYAPPRLATRDAGGLFRVPMARAARPASHPGADLLPEAQLLLQRLAESEQTRRLLLSLPSAEPADNYYISSRYGLRRDPFRGTRSMHYGLDLAGWRGEAVRAVAAGTVVEAGRAPAYGLMVEIDHGNGYRTRYGHMLRILVKKGERVEPGERIGLIGNTGRSTGTHLHWEVWQDGQPVDPLPFLKAMEDVRKLQELFAEPARGVETGPERG